LALQRGEGAEVIGLCEELLKYQATSELHVRMGNLLITRGDSVGAAQHYEQALESEPNCAPALFNWANALQEQHRIPESQAMFARAAAARPEQAFWRLRVKATCPVLWESTQAIDDYCGELSAELDRWLADPPPARPQDLVNAGAFPNFSFAYLGRNVRELKQNFGTLYGQYFQERTAPTGSGLKDRLRLGIVVTQRHEGIFLRCLTGILTHLDRERFEVVLFCPPASLAQIRDGLHPAAFQYITFPPVIEEAARVIRTAACDIMYFWEVGSDSLNYFLPYCRLAPVQCTSHGSQITSGHPSIGHFFSSQAMELPTAHVHYTERLWKAQSLLMNQPRLPTLVTRTRDHFGLPSKRTLYMCLQNPLKLHPDFDVIIQRILEADPQGTVVLLRGGQPAAEELLRTRFQRVMPGVAERIQLLPHQPFSDYLALLNLADVLLDPLYFGWGSSAYDVFSFNHPLVTFPTELNVGRVATAFYERIGMRDLIAQSVDDYVAIATRLGKEPKFRDYSRQRLSDTSELLFNERLAVSEHERFFQEIAAASGL
jgi:predicted O-linked N-acetylglucosamine transferase (SPINDLY family)